MSQTHHLRPQRTQTLPLCERGQGLNYVLHVSVL